MTLYSLIREHDEKVITASINETFSAVRRQMPASPTKP
ncbi:hypothetical protein DFR67_11674 [Williamsia limnetica]|uniref:Uncharacterized protein n=1 Tax=Williamsia limnetica TaxID=882452 RepID=A0A318RGL2_WILLI|nr:hypothetical protein DFR67_11674 [Williamsia limnetica]